MNRKHEVALLAREEVARLKRQGFETTGVYNNNDNNSVCRWIGRMGDQGRLDWRLWMLRTGSKLGALLLPAPSLQADHKQGRGTAVIDTVKTYQQHLTPVAVATDSAYVHDGLQGKALQRKACGWTTTHGLVINLDLWSELLQLILTSTC